jgi:hypothetical protein
MARPHANYELFAAQFLFDQDFGCGRTRIGKKEYPRNFRKPFGRSGGNLKEFFGERAESPVPFRES